MSSTIKMTMLSITLIVVVISVTTCANKNADYQAGENVMAAKTIEEVLKEHTDDLMSLPGVVGTAQGLCNDEPCIKVLVIKKTPELEKNIPTSLEGYPVVIEETGEIKALPKDKD